MIKLLTDLWRECTICAVIVESTNVMPVHLPPPQIKEEHELEEHAAFGK